MRRVPVVAKQAQELVTQVQVVVMQVLVRQVQGRPVQREQQGPVV